MYERFASRFIKDAGDIHQGCSVSVEGLPEGLRGLIQRLGGLSFNSGLYRLVAPGISSLANEFIAHAFPEFSDRTASFGYDWLGRIFALDSQRLESGSPGVLMFEPGTGEAFEIPCELVGFHENELVDDPEPALAASTHAQWLALGGVVPKLNECVGYKVPLFLGGKDVLENMELSDLDVYWTLMQQLIRQTRDLPPGTPIGSIEIKD
jgi:hypothetical protein